MAALNLLTPLALEGQWSGVPAVVVVVVAFIAFVGTVYMLLWSNLGATVAMHVTSIGFFGFMLILSAMWLFGAPGTVPGTGPRGTEPSWRPFLAESEQGREFATVLATFPKSAQSLGDWDQPGKKYSGGIDSGGEFENLKLIVTDALARRAAFQGLEATDAEDWDFRSPFTEPATEAEAAVPAATALAFRHEGTPILFGVTIPASDKHPAVTVFALYDKGKVFMPALMFFVVSLAMFALSTFALSRREAREEQERAAGAVQQPETAGV